MEEEEADLCQDEENNFDKDTITSATDVKNLVPNNNNKGRSPKVNAMKIIIHQSNVSVGELELGRFYTFQEDDGRKEDKNDDCSDSKCEEIEVEKIYQIGEAEVYTHAKGIKFDT